MVNKGDYYSIQGKYDEIIVANKHYPLSKAYNPGENPTAKAELLKLIKLCKRQVSQSVTITVVLEVMKLRQKLYQDYVNQDGKEAADRYSARSWL